MPNPSSSPVAQMANGGSQPYRCFIATSTGFFAVADSAGHVDIRPAGLAQTILANEAIAFWACASQTDPRSAGGVTVLSCPSLALTSLDVRNQSAMVTLDCSDNQITDLDLAGLVALENLYCEDNRLAALDLSGWTVDLRPPRFRAVVAGPGLTAYSLPI